jgi:nucleoside-diphosphate-sugar epimerase
MVNNNNIKNVLVTGGAGYVGSVLVPQLLKAGYHVSVLDLFIYGEHTLDEVKNHSELEVIKGDIRDQALLKNITKNYDAVIHLACISNDPSVELDPALSTSINYEAFEPLVKISKQNGIKRFIFASSGSVYGVSESKDITEDHPLVPVSYYNKYKALCEPVLKKYESSDFITVVVRPATICGYSPRLRLDLTVNILTNHAFSLGRITVFGGQQMRPNIHMQDIVDLYVKLLEYPAEMIAGKIFNAGFENYTVSEIANIVKETILQEAPEKKKIDIVTAPSDDIRSYHISSEKIQRELGFKPQKTIRDGVCDLIKAFNEGKIPDSMTDMRYYNVKLMKHLRLK